MVVELRIAGAGDEKGRVPMSRIHPTQRLIIVSLAALIAGSAAQSQIISPASLNWMAGPPGLPKGSQFAVLSGDPTKEGMFTIRARLPANFVVPPHHHPSDELVTVLSGNMALGMGDRLVRAKARTMLAGSYVVAKADMNHYVFTRRPTIIQITAHGPFAITYVNARDDPRKK